MFIGPSIGEDAAVLTLNGEDVLVVHSDPISGALQYLGELSIIIPGNDIAVSGARPKYYTTTILLPEDSEKDEVLNRIIGGMRKAAGRINAVIIGGHTEYTSAVNHPIVISTAFGFTNREKIVKTGGARPGDVVIMTKYAGIEGTAILASDFTDWLLEQGVEASVIEEAKDLIDMVSVIEEAYLLAKMGIPNSMHDPTEGGIIGGVLEIAAASGVTIDLSVSNVPIHPLTLKLCDALGISPLRMLSSGSLIATVPPEIVDEALHLLKSLGVNVAVIGEVRQKDGDVLTRIIEGGKIKKELKDPYVEDEVMALWRRRR
ncbi:MAG: hydrogenase assembly protein HupF [Thermoprotei archaeon]|nr:MAG: hydrogenase assembly protein HupF [Thermoprotei archaeon]